MDKERGMKKVHILLGVYCVLLVWIILFKLSLSITEASEMIGMRSINLIPFYYEDEVGFHFSEVRNNLLVFIPFGVYLKMIDVDSKKSILSGLLFSVVLEVCQFIFKLGASDITDIITNTLGTGVGVGLYWFIVKIFRDRDRINKVLEGLALFATIALIALLILLCVAS